MKKKILITAALLLTFSVTAIELFNYKKTTRETSHIEPVLIKADVFDNYKKTDFHYDIASRFFAITKAHLSQAKTLADIVPENALAELTNFTDITITALYENNEMTEAGTSDKLNDAQISLIHGMEYSTNYVVKSKCKYKNPDTGVIEDYDFVYYLTVGPEHIATYIDGKQALIDYLESESKGEIKHLKRDKLQPGKIEFTINTNGEIEQVGLQATSGFAHVDRRMIELIQQAPGKWKPATDENDNVVSQKIIYSFGIIGC